MPYNFNTFYHIINSNKIILQDFQDFSENTLNH